MSHDGDFGGSRNIFMKVGQGRLNIYDQPPRGDSIGAYHHIGTRVDNLADLRDRMASNGVEFRSDIREFGNWRYLMCEASALAKSVSATTSLSHRRIRPTGDSGKWPRREVSYGIGFNTPPESTLGKCHFRPTTPGGFARHNLNRF